MKTDDIVVKNSAINWKDIFALRDFKKGEIVLRWNISHTLSKQQFQKISDEEKEYITFLNGKYMIMQDPEKYVNHSCEANTKAKDFCDVAIRDIKKGEEITGNYSDTSSKNHMKCMCKSTKCKKNIVC